MISIIEINEVSKKIIGFYHSDKSLESICNSTSKKALVDCDLDSMIVFKNNETINVSFELIQDMNQLTHRDLYPVIAIDNNNTILMQAFANKNALELSFNTNYGHYFSRSRNKLWKKGEDSGHTQKIFSIMYSKDLNIIVYNVEQNVAACHTGYYSCFYRQILKNNEFNVLYKNKIFNPDLVYDKIK